MLHRKDVGETSLQVTFFTQEKGVVRARLKGGRKQSKQAILQPFTPLWLCFDERINGDYLRDVQAIRCTLLLPDLAVIPGLYVNELLYRFLQPHQDEPLLFIAYEKTLQALMLVESQYQVEQVLRRFEWQLLQMLGYLVSFTHEANQQQLICMDAYYQLQPAIGFVRASAGFLGHEIVAIANGSLTDEKILKVAKSVMRQLINNALNGIPIRTREFYHT